MASQHVEVEAAKLLHKLIQESKDEPAKLAMKLHVICQHMRSSGKEQSLPYQVISRAMETVVNQHGLDVELLRASRSPLPVGQQMSDSRHVRLKDNETPDTQGPTSSVGVTHPALPSSNWQVASSSQTKEAPFAGSFQSYGMINDSNTTPNTIHMARQDMLAANRPVMPSRSGSIGGDVHQGPASQRSSKSLDYESPSSLPMEDIRSANSQEGIDAVKADNETNKKDTRKAGSKRKKTDSAATANFPSDSMQQPDTLATGLNSRNAKHASKGLQSEFALKKSDHVQVNSARNTTDSDHLISVPDRGKQEDDQLPFEKISNKTRLLEEGEVSSSGNVFGLQKGGLPPSRNSNADHSSIWNQNRVTMPSENSQGSGACRVEPYSMINKEVMYPSNDPNNNMHEVTGDGSLPQSDGTGKVNVPTSGAMNHFPMQKIGFSGSYSNPSFENHNLFEKGKDVNMSETSTAFTPSDKAMMQARIASRMKGNAYNTPQGGGSQQWQTNDNALVKEEANLCDEPAKSMDMSTSRSTGLATGSGVTSQTSGSSSTPFREQDLKQLRAQCLVFLAFRNGLMPRKLHLEVALGDGFSKEGGDEDGAQKGNASRGDTCLKESANSHESSSMFGRPIQMARVTPAPLSSFTGSMVEADSSRDMENPKKYCKLPNSDMSVMAEESKHLSALRQKSVSEIHTIGTANSRSPTTTPHEMDSLGHVAKGGYNGHSQQEHIESFNQKGNLTNRFSPISSVNTNQKNDRTIMSRTGIYDDDSKDSPATSVCYREQSMGRVGTSYSKSQNISSGDVASKLRKLDSPMPEANTFGDNGRSPPFSKEQNAQPVELANSQHLMNPSKFSMRVGPTEKLAVTPKPLVNSSLADDYSRSRGLNGHKISASTIHDNQKLCVAGGVKPVSILKNENPVVLSGKSNEREEENESETDNIPASSPKHTTSEKWIIVRHKRKLAEEKTWVLKQRKVDERIKACIDKSKENVSSSEDLSAKTKNVIELKKLLLLQLQRRLRSGFLNDYFKPIASDMERLKTMKKHRDGRRRKQLERFEQKMKEERQRRFRERQKEFFGEIEGHREKLEECFKIKRERSKGFNKYVKEFHKRKERIHREKIDKIQREKINLLKNNDVEGYLRMVQDAKSDRVKQLLKETENYLKKLSSKLQESKTISRKFESEMGENRAVNVVEISDVANDNEDESDQAQHYLVSNEKYYTMAHSVKENIHEQPSSLQGGKLREYQMNGLRWLVSLYNNHLNGILADEMGLGKTVQVIALICYLMETKKDRGPFLIVVPSSVLPGWESEMSFWAPGINKIIYAGLPEERRRLFKERITRQNFNVLLTTYEYLMNKHDRPKLCKIQWRYIIIDEGHRIKNASCKLNADLKLYQSSHRLLLTGTPLQNNLEELWALLNFLLPDIFNSSEDFSQWFNKPFEGSGDTSADEALLSEEENLLIINRLHQVLRPFVLRRLKHKVENELPEKIERLVRCEASAYQQLLIKRVKENLGAMGNAKVRSVHNTVMELRNICNHPYLSQLHAEEINSSIPKHYLPPVVRLCGKLEMLDRLLPKLKATGHRVLFFSTMTRLLDIMEDYLLWKHYRYLRLDGHTAGTERGALIREFNRPDSQAFIFLLSIRAGGVGVNLQAADTVIIFDTDWNPQVDLQAQARAHRIGQKKEVLVLRFETVHTVEEQVRASAEHKLGVANQSITAGFFDNNTSAEDRREYLESLFREGKKDEACPVLDDDALNDLLARSESEIDIFEAVDKQRREEEMAAWQILVHERPSDGPETLSLPSRLVTEEDLKSFYTAMRIYETQLVGLKRKGEHVGSLDVQRYGRGKRAREVRSYEEQWTEEEFEQLCQDDSGDLHEPADALTTADVPIVGDPLLPKSEPIPNTEHNQSVEPVQSMKEPESMKEPKPSVKRGRGRPKRGAIDTHTQPSVVPALLDSMSSVTGSDSNPAKDPCAETSAIPAPVPSMPPQVKTRKPQTRETSRGRGRKQKDLPSRAAVEANNDAGVLGEVVALAQDGLNVNTSSGNPSVPPVSYEANTGKAPRGRGRGRGLGRGRGRKQNVLSSSVVAEANKATVILGSTDASQKKPEVGALSLDGPNVITSLGNPSDPSLSLKASTNTVPDKAADLASSPKPVSSQADGKLEIIYQPMEMPVSGISIPANEFQSASAGRELISGTVPSAEQMFGASIPTMPVLVHDLKDDRTHGTGSSDITSNIVQKPQEVSSFQSSNEASSAMESEFSDKIAAKHNDVFCQNTPNTDPGDVKPDEKPRPFDAQASTSSGENAVTWISSESAKLNILADNSGSLPLQSTQISVRTDDALKAIPPSIASGDTATNHDSHTLKSGEFLKHQELAKSDNTDEAPDLMAGSIKNETVPAAASGQINSSISKDVSAVAAVRRGSESKASVTRKKAAAREPRNRSSSTTAACERRARLAGLKQVDGLMVDSKGKFVQGVSISKKQDSDYTTVLPVSSGMACNVEEIHREPTQIETSEEKLDLPIQSNLLLDSTLVGNNPITAADKNPLLINTEESVKAEACGTDVSLIKKSPLPLNEVVPTVAEDMKHGILSSEIAEVSDMNDLPDNRVSADCLTTLKPGVSSPEKQPSAKCLETEKITDEETSLAGSDEISSVGQPASVYPFSPVLTSGVELNPSSSGLSSRVELNEKTPDFVKGSDSMEVTDKLCESNQGTCAENEGSMSLSFKTLDTYDDKIVVNTGEAKEVPDSVDLRATHEPSGESCSTLINAAHLTADVVADAPQHADPVSTFTSDVDYGTTDCVQTGGASIEKIEQCSIGEVNETGAISTRSISQNPNELTDKESILNTVSDVSHLSDVPIQSGDSLPHPQPDLPSNASDPDHACDTSLADKCAEDSPTVEKADNSTKASCHDIPSSTDVPSECDMLSTGDNNAEVPASVAGIERSVQTIGTDGAENQSTAPPVIQIVGNLDDGLDHSGTTSTDVASTVKDSTKITDSEDSVEIHAQTDVTLKQDGLTSVDTDGLDNQGTINPVTQNLENMDPTLRQDDITDC